MHTHEKNIDNDDYSQHRDLELFKTNVYRIKNRIKNIRIKEISKIQRYRNRNI